METNMTPQESLQLIESMIGQAKKSFSRMSFYFLLWGMLLIGAMIATYLLRGVEGVWSQGGAWGVAGALGGVISSIYGARQDKAESVANPMDRITGWVWATFVITMIIMIVCTSGKGQDPGAMITLLTGLPTFLTGQIMRFRPLILGGILFWIAGIAMYFTGDALTLTLLYCGAMLFGYIVPGIMLKRQEDVVRTA
ncbi:MAG: hypothetical protein IPO90_09025 [Flavobacteriales bacterium]|nr:hypothetical protein [Flavobacteriales bacterium]MBL0046417.1 hypothetical protein [Flavobacteriales bacterium]